MTMREKLYLLMLEVVTLAGWSIGFFDLIDRLNIILEFIILVVSFTTGIIVLIRTIKNKHGKNSKLHR